MVISAMLIGLVLVGALNALGGATRSTRTADDHEFAVQLAECMMAEVMAMAYEDPDDPAQVVFGIEADEVGATGRTAYDDMDDYDNWAESPPAYRGGTPVPNATGWTWQVNIKKQPWSSPVGATLQDSDTDEGLRKIMLKVTSPDGDVTNMSCLCSKVGAMQQPTGVAMNAIGEVVVTIDVNGEVLSGAVAPINHALD